MRKFVSFKFRPEKNIYSSPKNILELKLIISMNSRQNESLKWASGQPNKHRSRPLTDLRIASPSVALTFSNHPLLQN